MRVPHSGERTEGTPGAIVQYEVEREIEQHWYPIARWIDSDSAAQAVAQAALTEGVYRARPAGRAAERYELFRVPPWGGPISLGTG